MLPVRSYSVRMKRRNMETEASMRKSVYRRRLHAKAGVADEPGTPSTPTRRTFGSAKAPTASSRPDSPSTPPRRPFGSVKSTRADAVASAAVAGRGPDAEPGTASKKAAGPEATATPPTPVKVHVTLPEDDESAGHGALRRYSASPPPPKPSGLLEVPEARDAIAEVDQDAGADGADPDERAGRHGELLARSASPLYVAADRRRSRAPAAALGPESEPRRSSRASNLEPSLFGSRGEGKATAATLVAGRVYVAPLPEAESPSNDSGELVESSVSVQEGSVAPSKMVTFQIAGRHDERR